MLSYTSRKLGRWTLISGVTRIVIVGRKYAVKVPNYQHGFIRGWLANQSEWQQRRRPDALTPIRTFLHVALVFPKAWCPTEVEFATYKDGLFLPGDTFLDYTGDEAKPTSWGWYHKWVLIDFDRAWDRISFAAWLYYKNEDRKGRKWSAL